jgi:ubiquinol oxidase
MAEPMPKLNHEELLRAQQETLTTSRRHYGLFARALFVFMDAVYGKKGHLRKFQVLEIVARMPYQTWEHVAYVAITHKYKDTSLAKSIHKRIAEARAQQDNEQWHLLIMEELIEERRLRRGKLRYVWLPQVVAFVYYQLSWVLYVIRPYFSYKLNADFEDHAEHEYMTFVADHPELENEKWQSAFTEEYGRFDTVADLFRQIAHDERVHKLESLEDMKKPRFSEED